MSIIISWLYLLVAISLEISGFLLMKFIKNIISWKTLIMLCIYALSLIFCTLAARKIELSIIYAVWCALGISIIAIIDIIIFGESNSIFKIIFFTFIIIGIIGIVLNSNSYNK